MPSEPLVLGFDTSAAHCAAALLSGSRLLAHRHEDMKTGQAERLFPLLEEVLAQAGATWQDLSAIGVGTGPGNFTGIRISVSAARGLALALSIPAIGVSTLEAQAFGTPGVVISTVAAPRDQLYLQIIGGGETAAPVLASLVALPPIPASAGPACIGAYAADVAAQCAGTPRQAAFPLPEAIARLAARRLGQDLPPPAPLYIRGADAAPARDAPPVILADDD
ncbi:tRNA (adenosine(37)-N6)-threonylcarbamoyltransferase complex dimerization subunit type 1 TsaB [Sediminimonas sp.]|uniref:tRNA (adenosine(37)-N6)-threonylcarbamoyltransferase complex dimerization subunit type 1 TsaB n=1 Tax=Sediminimonas sp. TaxID=2823379 RepID=UPI0025F6BA60|nr:tRNA (adenosine(37)-N6)-threonylcarbamoyltransferase complex dimerization subunit type 1 TsaB [Sediminimonas sp.]